MFFRPQVHPVTQLIPRPSNRLVSYLVEAIKADGQTEPIILTEDDILLDGRARLVACQIVGVDPRLTIFTGSDPLQVIVTGNPSYQRLTQNQKAMIAGRLRYDFHDPIDAALRTPQEQAAHDRNAEAHSLTTLAHTFAVSAPRISMATTTWTYTYDEAEHVLNGWHSLDAAYQKARARRAQARNHRAADAA